MGVFRIVAQRLRHRRKGLSAPADHHAVSLGLALTATCASRRVATLADFPRGFTALFHTTMTSKAFSNQVAKPHGAAFIRPMTSRLLGAMTLTVLGFEKGRACAEFRHIIMQDGSAFAIHDAVREVWPGRVKVVKPAAVELHTTMDLLCDTGMEFAEAA